MIPAIIQKRRRPDKTNYKIIGSKEAAKKKHVQNFSHRFAVRSCPKFYPSRITGRGFNSPMENIKSRSRPEPMSPGKQTGKRTHTCPGSHVHPCTRTHTHTHPPYTLDHPRPSITPYMSDRKFYFRSFLPPCLMQDTPTPID